EKGKEKEKDDEEKGEEKEENEKDDEQRQEGRESREQDGTLAADSVAQIQHGEEAGAEKENDAEKNWDGTKEPQAEKPQAEQSQPHEEDIGEGAEKHIEGPKEPEKQGKPSEEAGLKRKCTPEEEEQPITPRMLHFRGPKLAA
ncbi:hypothetical protein KEM55_008615, partial [Ascosphaera atra]